MAKKVSGCDFGEKYLKFGQNRGLNLYQGEIDKIKTLNISQYLVILSHVMEHFNDLLQTMNNIIELKADNKYLLVEVPGIFYFYKVEINPILDFQNAHIYTFYYYYYYLKIFFETLGLEVIYGDERCTFLLKKPSDWKRKNNIVVYDKNMDSWAKKNSHSLKKYYLINIFSPRAKAIKILEILGIKNIIKELLYKVKS